MLVKEDLRSTENELLDKYSSYVIHRSYVRRDSQKKRFNGILQLRFLDKSL